MHLPNLAPCSPALPPCPPPPMALSFPNFPSWLWRNPTMQPPSSPSSPDSCVSSPSAADMDSVAYPHSGRGNNTSMKKSSIVTPERPPRPSFQAAKGARRRLQRNRHNRDVQSLDLDFDMVLVSSDVGYCLSSSDSEDSDWSVGWFEPHAPDFCSEGEPENSFAVLVPCYGSPSPETIGANAMFGNRRHEEGSKSQLWAAVLSSIAKESQADTNQYLQQWLSSLQG